MVDISLIVPDRFENLRRKANDDLGTIVVPVAESLVEIDKIYARMKATARGAFIALRGNSGAGKSTFLHTIGFFRDGVSTLSVHGSTDIRSYFNSADIGKTGLFVHVLEEREALREYTDRELEDWIHAINGFIRSDAGENSLIVWPCNTDALRDRVVEIARTIGGETLLGTSKGWLDFSGPTKDQFASIAKKTLSTLNQGSGLSDLGLTAEDLERASDKSENIGGFMTRLSELTIERSNALQTLVAKEQCRLWVIVAAGNDPIGDVSGLTRGQFAEIDTERLMTSTGANVVADLKRYPEKIGLLGNVLDARILHLPVLAASEIMRSFGSNALKAKMKALGLKVTGNKAKAIERLRSTELGSIFQAGTQGTLTRGKKLGSSSVETFNKLANIAENNDNLLNEALGKALVEAGMIDSFATEQNFGSGLKRRTDLLAQKDGLPIRIELMWRKKTGRADISNYTLVKLANYGRAIGYLK